jgi:hypothetical protein
MSGLFKLAIESDDAITEIPVELQEDADLNDLIAEASAPDEEVEAAAAALESLFEQQLILESLKEDKIQGSATAAAVRAVYGRGQENPALESLSLEGYDVALEGIGAAIRTAFDDMFQAMVLSRKHKNEFFAGLFTTVERKLNNQRARLQKTQAEYNSKKDRFRDGRHHGSMLELWYFFSDKSGPVADPLGALDTDVEISGYILKDYMKAVLDTLHKASTAIRQARIRNETDLLKLIGDIEKLPNIRDLYDSRYMGEGILLDATTVLYIPGGEPANPVVVDGKQCRNLASKASKGAVEEKMLKRHIAAKIASKNPHGKRYMNSQLPSFDLTTEEIGDIIDYGKQYIANVDACMLMRRQMEVAGQEFVGAIEHLKRNVESDLPQLRQALKQIVDYTTVLSNAIQTPILQEIRRSVKGARYCDYFALRMIYNAKPMFK